MVFFQTLNSNGVLEFVRHIFQIVCVVVGSNTVQAALDVVTAMITFSDGDTEACATFSITDDDVRIVIPSLVDTIFLFNKVIYPS